MLSETWRILLVIFTVYRICELIAVDSGPYRVFEKLRSWAGRKVSIEQATRRTNNGLWYNISELLHCPFCLGIWGSAICALLVIFPSVFGDIILLVFGVAGAQTLLETFSKNVRR